MQVNEGVKQAGLSAIAGRSGKAGGSSFRLLLCRLDAVLGFLTQLRPVVYRDLCNVNITNYYIFVR